MQQTFRVVLMEDESTRFGWLLCCVYFLRFGRVLGFGRLLCCVYFLIPASSEKEITAAYHPSMF